MAGFTVILDFKGGTYISQVLAQSPAEALAAWASELKVEEIHGMGYKMKERLIAHANHADLVPLTGLWGVWCTTASLHSGSALINIVRTAMQ